MSYKEFGKELEKKTFSFAIQTIRLSSNLPSSPEGRVIRQQITKSGTSVGANYREANRARSKADFHNKINICETECSETQYWLEIIEEMKWIVSEQLKPIHKECSELLAIFTSIGKK